MPLIQLRLRLHSPGPGPRIFQPGSPDLQWVGLPSKFRNHGKRLEGRGGVEGEVGPVAVWVRSTSVLGAPVSLTGFKPGLKSLIKGALFWALVCTGRAFRAPVPCVPF